MDCRVCAHNTPQAPDSHGVGSCSASAAPRKPTVAMAKQAPHSRPYRADRLAQADKDMRLPLAGSDRISTPTVASTMASRDSGVGSSCRKRVANRATCSTSVLDKVTATAKLRSFMASSSAAVAAIWEAAPSTIQPK